MISRKLMRSIALSFTVLAAAGCTFGPEICTSTSDYGQVTKIDDCFPLGRNGRTCQVTTTTGVYNINIHSFPGKMLNVGDTIGRVETKYTNAVVKYLIRNSEKSPETMQWLDPVKIIHPGGKISFPTVSCKA